MCKLDTFTFQTKMFLILIYYKTTHKCTTLINKQSSTPMALRAADAPDTTIPTNQIKIFVDILWAINSGLKPIKVWCHL